MSFPPRAFFAHLYESFVRVRGGVFTIVSVLLALVPLFWDEVPSIRISWFFAAGVFAFLLIVTLGDAAWRAYCSAVSPLPRVVAVRKPQSEPHSGTGLLLLEPSPLFAQGVAVSIYVQEENFEVLVAYGSVNTVQQNGLIQVVVHQVLEPYREEFVKAIEEKKREYFARCIIKPTVPWRFSSWEAS